MKTLNLICKIWGCKVNHMQAIEMKKSGELTAIIMGCARCGSSHRVAMTIYFINFFKRYFYSGN